MLALVALSVASAEAARLDVLRVGLGHGAVTAAGGLGCGFTCSRDYPAGTTVKLTAHTDDDSEFVGWIGACSGNGPTCTVRLDEDRAVVAAFQLRRQLPQLQNLQPGALRKVLAKDPDPLLYQRIETPSQFVAALPSEFRRNWILMTRSESLQTGTADLPRILLPNDDATIVFSIGLAPHGSYPGAHPLAIEFMQWDASDKNFRFHEVVLGQIPAMGSLDPRSRGIAIDDFKCAACHTTGNVLNRTNFPGTTGRVPGTLKAKGKPNWDAYDSWGGMMPFNRDRVYRGSIEEAAFRHIFNLWNWRGLPVRDEARRILEQLVLQSNAGVGTHGIHRNIAAVSDEEHILFGFGGLPPILTSTDDISYSFGTGEPASEVEQGGRYVTLRHNDPQPFAGATNDNYNEPVDDEGRAVQLFDLLGGFDADLNGQRIADELIHHRLATGGVAIDVRPLALAIFKGCLRRDAPTNTVVSSSAASPLTIDHAFFTARNGLSINEIFGDTRARAQSLPRRKADIQYLNLDRAGDPYLVAGDPGGGLIETYGAASADGVDVSIPRIRQEMFRRPRDVGAMSTVLDGALTDREQYAINTPEVTLARYLLEPLGVAVDKWSMSVRGRSRTYTFADVLFSTRDAVTRALVENLEDDPIPGLADPNRCSQLIEVINDWYADGPSSLLPDVDGIPEFADVQRIFNRSCIECHGGLDYPPYSNHPGTLDLAEAEHPVAGATRLSASYAAASAMAASLQGPLFQRVTQGDEACPGGKMPCGGPSLSQTDIETLRRWIEGGTPRTAGDPHIVTVGGVSYDFQAAGEFVLLRGEGFELQARQAAVDTVDPLGPDEHTGLTSCVSVNTAFAVRSGGHRITLQPSAVPAMLDLRIDGGLVAPGILPLVLGDVRVEPTAAPDGVAIVSGDGMRVVITPRYWDHHRVWVMNLEVQRARATRGLMGSLGADGWLPALPDGSFVGPRPTTLAARYSQLYDVVGAAWRVTPETSLFDYAPGESTALFADTQWPLGESPTVCKVGARPDGQPPRPALPPLPEWHAELYCKDVDDPLRRRHCVDDVAVTGAPEFAEVYLADDLLASNKVPDVPALEAPASFEEVTQLPVTVSWRSTSDPDGDSVRYSVCVWPAAERFTLSACRELSTSASSSGLVLGETLTGLDLGTSYVWKIVADDGLGGRSESETWRFDVTVH